MEEVNEQQLPSYLRQLKKEGYSLVGLEQTVTSKLLGQVQLPKKMALVLGHEKEGIPIDIIQVCIMKYDNDIDVGFMCGDSTVWYYSFIECTCKWFNLIMGIYILLNILLVMWLNHCTL